MPRNDVKRIALGGMLAAVAVVLMLFEVPLPFLPPFYKIDASELPVIIGAFAMGPWAGALIELIKIFFMDKYLLIYYNLLKR